MQACRTYSELVLPVGKLAELAVEAGSLLLEVPADLRLEPAEMERRIIASNIWTAAFYIPGVGVG